MTPQIQRLTDILQEDVKCILHNRVVRRGKFLIFNLKKLNLVLTFLTPKNENKTYEVPYPYDIVKTKEGLMLDYRLRTLALGNEDKLQLLEELGESDSRFFDTTLNINVNS